MNYRIFPKIKDCQVSVLGFGLMRLPLLQNSEEIDKEKTRKLIKLAVEQGVNYFDTAYPYHHGKSEIIFGEIVKEEKLRDKIYIADKMPVWDVKKEEDFYRILDEQLAKLQTDYIDFYLLHAMDANRWEQVKKLNVTNFLEHAKSQGKIKHIGFSFHDNYNAFKKMCDEYGGFELRELRNRNIKFNDKNRPNLCYPFYVNPNNKDEHGLLEISLEPHDGFIEVMPAMSQGIQTVWRWGKEKSQKNLNINIKGKPMKEKNRYMIVEKYRDEKVMPRSVWWDKNTNTEKGTLLLKEILGDKSFDYPKPVELIQRICEMGTDKESIVLDFFAGSGTTGHAVMELNKKDGGNRKFILCTNNENNICENVTYRRLNNIITGYENSKKEHIKGYNNINLKYYKTSCIPKINDDNNNLKENLMKNIVNLIQLENGIKIDNSTICVFLDEEELDKFSLCKEKLDNCQKIYISSDILLTSEEEKRFEENNIKVYIIPEYYFEDEIMEVA